MRVVIPSVGYGDMLAVTLPAWQAMLPFAKFVVVTSPDDRESQAVATRCRARVVQTDCWTARGATFNKGGALDLAFGFDGGRVPGHGERCLSLDVDVFPFGTFPEARPRRNTIYGCPRYHCATPADLEAHTTASRARETFPLMLPRHRGQEYLSTTTPTAEDIRRLAEKCLGYFQYFRYRPGLRFGFSRTAGKCDLTFRDQFAHRQAVDGVYVLHLGASTRANWRGRVVERWERAS